MKKLLFIIFSFFIIISLGACSKMPTSSTNITYTTSLDVQETQYQKTYMINPENYEMEYNEDGTAAIKKYVGDETNLIIPNVVVKDENEYWITTIEKEAFYNKYKITHVFISEGIKIIEPAAFLNCLQLSSVSIPNSIEQIDGAFSECYDLEKGYNEYEGGYYLGNNSNLYLVLMKTKKDELENFEVNPNTRILYGQSITGCSNLKSLFIPKSVTHIGYNLIGGANKLESLIVDKDNKVYDSRDNCNAIIETETDRLVCISINGYIPNSVKIIGPYSFSANFETITIPYGVNKIEAGAFIGLKQVKSIVIPDSVTSIGAGAFQVCHALKAIKLPANLQIINNNMFLNCISLESVVIPAGVKSIEDDAFFGCRSLSKFYYCSSTPNHNDIRIVGENNGYYDNVTWYYQTTKGEKETEKGYWWYYDDNGEIQEIVI